MVVAVADVVDVVLGYGEKKRLLKLIRGRKTEHRLVVRAWIVWRRFIRGLSVSATARELGVTRPTVRLWADRYARARTLSALEDASRSGERSFVRRSTR